MKTNSPGESKVDAAFASIEKIERATPPHSVYAKCMAAIQQPRTPIWEKLGAVLLLPRVALAVICFIIIINGFVLYSKFARQATPAPDVTEVSSSDEYSFAATSLYDLENEKP